MRTSFVALAQALVAVPIVVGTLPVVGSAGLVLLGPLLLVFGVPLAGWARARADDLPLRLLGLAAFVLVLSATLPSVFGAAAPLAVLAWGLVLVPSVRLALVGCVVASAAVAAFGAIVPAVGAWTLLEPQWGGASDAWPRLLAAALVLAGLTGLRDVDRGDPRRSLRAGGLAWTAAIGASAAWAVADRLGFDGTPLLLPFVLASILPPAPALEGRERPVIAAVGATFTGLFAGPAAEASEVALVSGLPLIAAVMAARIAALERGPGRWAAVAAAAALGAAAFAGFPGFPASVAAGATLALLPVVFLWTAGSAWVRSEA